MKATNDSEAAQEARNHSSSSSLDLGMPGSTLNTPGSNGQNDPGDSRADMGDNDDNPGGSRACLEEELARTSTGA